MKVMFKIMLILGVIVMFARESGPRLMSEVLHTRDFVPVQSYRVTNYKCTNWNLFMFNDCTATFVSMQSGESREITDWRFGRAPSDPVRLLQRRDDASSVTTDVSLRTLWNRILLALTLVVFGAVLGITLIANAFKDDDAPVVAPSGDEGAPVAAPSGAPALEPAGRPTFGKRQA